MGELYKAVDTRLNRTVAIKLLRADIAHDAASRRRFDREARAIGALAHPHICVLYDVGEHQGELFLVLEHLHGETLAARLARGPLPVEETIRIAHQIALSLDAAHRQGVLHLDLTPRNIMLTRTGVKLLDFGIAALRGEGTADSRSAQVAETSTMDATRTIAGTAPYVAPERIEGRQGDARTDIFSFGAVLFEMLTGQRAFGGDSQAAVLAAILETPPKLDAPAPVALNRIVRRCLAKDPEDRWQNARDLAEALSLIGDRPTTVSRVESPRGRRRLLAAGIGLLLAAMLGALTWFFAGRSSEVPVVVLMDSTNPERVYDPQTRADRGTNSDDITDTLGDLPLAIHKETTSASWRREEQVLRQNPALVMLHLSSFAPPHDGSGPVVLIPEAEERTRTFMAFIGLGNPTTRFIVYTRSYSTPELRQAWVSETEQRFPALKGRVEMLNIPGSWSATFRDPATRQLVRERVIATLGLK